MENNLQVTTLKRRSDFESIRIDGRPIKINLWLVAFYKRSKFKVTRVGWTLPSYVGTAVVRNRIKRWIREYLRKFRFANEVQSVDLNVVFKRQKKNFYKSLKHEELNAALDSLFAKVQRFC